MSPFRALALAFGTLGSLRFWPGDRVRVYGEPAVYVRLTPEGYHVVVPTGCCEQVAPPESVRRQQ